MTHYFFESSEQVRLYEKLCIAVNKDKDLGLILKSSTVDLSEYPVPKALGDVIFDAIAKDKKKSAKSILEHIQSKESLPGLFYSGGIYSQLAKKLVKACNKDKRNAEKVIEFAKEHDILEHLFEDLHEEIRIELFKKVHGKYVHSAGTMVRPLGNKHMYKCAIHVFYHKEFRAAIAIGFGISCLPFVWAFLASLANDPTHKMAILNAAGTLSLIFFGLVVTFAICAGVVSSISNAISNGERNKIIKELQEQPQNVQSSQPQNADGSTTEGQGVREEQGVDEEAKPSPDSSVSGIVGSDTEVRRDESKRR